MTSERDLILARVHRALEPLATRAAAPNWDDSALGRPEAETRTAPAVEVLFAARLTAVNGRLFRSASDLADFLAQSGWRHGYCDPTLWATLQPAFSEEFSVETQFDRARVDEYAFGITRATGAIAETGTVILTDRDTPSRLAALAPWVHVAVLTRTNLHHDLPAALSAHPDDPNIIWVTGPSKTADVEGILIEGVHGPGIQAVLLIDG